MPAAVADPVRLRAIELGRTMGCRGVVAALAREGHVVGKSAVAEWLRAGRARRAGARHDGPAGGPAPRAAAAPAPAKQTKGSKVPATAPAPAPAQPPPEHTEEELRDVDPSALDFNALLALDEEVTTFLRTAYKDEDERRYAVLARLKLDVRIALEKLRPAPKVDPDKDPLALAARAAVLNKLRKMVANAKAQAAKS